MDRLDSVIVFLIVLSLTFGTLLETAGKYTW